MSVFAAFMAALRKKGHACGGGSRQVKCMACDHDILIGWKLCPYCGVLLESDVRNVMCAEPGAANVTEGVNDGEHRKPSL